MEKKVRPAGVLVAVGLGTAVALGVFREDASPGPSQVPSPSSASSSFSPPSSPTSALAPGENHTDLPFAVPAGWSIETLAEVPGARVVVRDGFGNYWVSQPSRGTVSHLDMSGSTVRAVSTPLRGLKHPHGLAIGPEEGGSTLYVAEENRIDRVRLYSDAPIEKVADLPGGGMHATRSIGFGPDGRLYFSAGSTCNACAETDPERAAIVSMNADGSDRRIEAVGLRNAVFFAWNGDGMWATEMGRDGLGDSLPPDEVNFVREGGDYGWPRCYGARVRDRSVPGDTECAGTDAPAWELPAHVAPLGLAFLEGDAWPEPYRGDLLVAEHGSWNSSVKVGYAIVRIPLGADGAAEGGPVDFLTGFLDGSTVRGRPVGILAQEDGALLLTDDRNGAVYRMKQL
jgi:glucose/arabinose dehydrogenase